MLLRDVIKPAHARQVSSVVLSRRNGTLHSWATYRKSNAAMIGDSHRIPQIHECKDSFVRAMIFSTFHDNSRYWQAQIADEHRYKTAFTSYNRLFHYKLMPFGLGNARKTLQLVSNILLKKFKRQLAFVSSDDMVIFSRTTDGHIDHVRKVWLPYTKQAWLCIWMNANFKEPH